MLFELKKISGFFTLNFWNSRAFAFMAFLTIVISLLMFILTFFTFGSIIQSFVQDGGISLYLPEQLKEATFNFIWGNIFIYLPILGAAFFAAGSISYELEQKTIYQLFSLPVSREVILLGKLISSFIATATIVTIYISIQFLSFVIAFQTLPSLNFVTYYFLALLLTFSDVSMGIAVSTFFSKQSNAYISYLILYIVVMDILSLIFQASGLNPLLIKTNADRIVYRVFMNLDPYVLYYGGSISPAPIWQILYSLEILLAYSGCFLFIAYLMFLRRGIVK